MFAAAGGLLAVLALGDIAVADNRGAGAGGHCPDAVGLGRENRLVAACRARPKEASNRRPVSVLGAVRPLMPPHTEESYLQHEMGFVVARMLTSDDVAGAWRLAGGDSVPCLGRCAGGCRDGSSACSSSGCSLPRQSLSSRFITAIRPDGKPQVSLTVKWFRQPGEPCERKARPKPPGAVVRPFDARLGPESGHPRRPSPRSPFSSIRPTNLSASRSR